MKKFLKVHVITDDDVEFIKDDGYENPEDIDCNTYDFEWDYAQMALIDSDNKEVLIWDDNIHTRIEDKINSFLEGFGYSGEQYAVTEIAMMDDKIKENYTGKRY